MIPVEPWSWMAGSVRGSSHIMSGMPRQDHYWTDSFHDDRTIVVVMCDGAGGASHGGAGAALVVRVIRELIRDAMSVRESLPTQEQLADWLEIARDMLERSATASRLPIEAFATTAMIAVSDAQGTTTAHIGDGFICARFRGETDWQGLSAPQRGEYAGTTAFLTDTLICPVTSSVSRPLDCLCLATDGLEAAAWNEAAQQPHTPFFTGLVGAVKVPAGPDLRASTQLRAWLSSPALGARLHDDLTICLATRIAS